MRPTVILLAAALLTGCPGDDDDSAVQPPPPGEPTLRLVGNMPGQPGALDFGQSVVGLVEVAELTLANEGGSTLLLAPPTFSGDLGFELASPDGWAARIEPGGEAIVRVAWTPGEDGQVVGHMVFETSDPASQVVDVVLNGDGLGPRLEVAPEAIDFGEVLLFCAPVEADLYVGNTGRAPLTLSGVSLEVFADPAEIALESGQVEATLEPGEILPLTFSFAPTVVGQQLGLLTLASDDPTRPGLQVELAGAGQLPPVQVDSFQAGLAQAVDILWVLDNSGSLSPASSIIASNLGEWFDEQLGSGAIDDWHLGVITGDIGDDGHLRGPVRVIKSDTANAADLFDQAANVGGSGSGIEQPFHSAWRALQPDNTDGGGYNQGFLRTDAALALIFMCNEAEQSGSLQGWIAEDFLAEWQTLKLDPADVVVSAVSGGLIGCGGPFASATPGVDFVTVAELSGGLDLSVCATNWAADFFTGPWHTIGTRDRFDLSAVPIVDSLTVELGGVPLPPERWSLDPVENQVLLEAAASPDPGEELRISYVPEAACSP